MTQKQSSRGGKRQLHQAVKTAKGRKISSTHWLQRQLNDPYVKRAKEEGYRSRAAYKIIEIDDKFSLFKPGMRVVDLGAAPGGWTQVAVQRAKGGTIIGIDLEHIEPIAGALLIQHDFTDDNALTLLANALGGEKADILLSDMAAPACGHTPTDHLRIVHLCELAFDCAKHSLRKGGHFVAKILQGGTEHELLQDMKRHFKTVRHFKPPASRQDSAEMYVVALDFKGTEDDR